MAEAVARGYLPLRESHCNAGSHSLLDKKTEWHICSEPRGKVQHLGQEKVVKQAGHVGTHHIDTNDRPMSTRRPSKSRQRKVANH